MFCFLLIPCLEPISVFVVCWKQSLLLCLSIKPIAARRPWGHWRPRGALFPCLPCGLDVGDFLKHPIKQSPGHINAHQKHKCSRSLGAHIGRVWLHFDYKKG